MGHRLMVIHLGLVGLLFLGSCVPGQTTPPRRSLEELIAIVENPSASHEDFAAAISELIEMGPAAAPAAPALAKAMTYARHDAGLAALVLIPLGPAAEPVAPEVFEQLDSPRSLVRRNATCVFAAIGPSARCAVPRIAEQLWDEDPGVRTAAANALEKISESDLVDKQYEVDLSSPLPCSPFADLPEGIFTSRAREWWEEEGQFLDWSGEPNICKP